MNCWPAKVPQAGRRPACKAVFDPDLEQGGNLNVVVRRDPPPETRPALWSTAPHSSTVRSDPEFVMRTMG